MSDAVDSGRLRARLDRGLGEMGLSLDAAIRDQLIAYLLLLERWNRNFNLTAVRDPLQMVSRHLLESLAIRDWVIGPRVIDVGSGAGLPGIPLALALPDYRFSLLDSNGKKTRFCRQVVLELGLANVEVLQARAEMMPAHLEVDCVIARAFTDPLRLVAITRQHLAAGGRWLAMLGHWDERTAQQLRGRGLRVQRHLAAVPGVAAARHVMIIEPSALSHE